MLDAGAGNRSLLPCLYLSFCFPGELGFLWHCTESDLMEGCSQTWYLLCCCLMPPILAIATRGVRVLP